MQEPLKRLKAQGRSLVAFVCRGISLSCMEKKHSACHSLRRAARRFFSALNQQKGAKNHAAGLENH